MNEQNQQPLMIYFADPMCSWCWGFAPVIKQLRANFGSVFDCTLVMGGLRRSPEGPLDQHMRASIREHWEHVNQASSQPFNFEFFDRESFIYDTEPACRAVVAVRLLDRELAFEFLTAVQRAFYAENRDVTNAVVLREVAEENGIDGAEFQRVFEDPETGLVTGNDFMVTQSAGIQGFPALVVGTQALGLAALTIGYQGIDAMCEIVERWLAQSNSAQGSESTGA